MLLLGGSGPLQDALDVALVADEWSVVRPAAGGAEVAGVPAEERLEPFWTAPTPPGAIVAAIDPTTDIAEAAATLGRWIGRLAPGGSAVLVREFGPAWTFNERLLHRAMTELTGELARRAAPSRRVNAVYGSPVPTDVQRLPLRRGGTVADLAAAATFLAGPASAFVTGVVVLVDGGAHLRWPLVDA